MAEKKRIYYLDFLRAFAAMMVILVHSISDYIVVAPNYGSKSWYVYLVLNAFSRTGVPLFFMISGYLLLSSDRSRSIKAFYKKSLTHIIIPLVFWNVAYYAYKYLMGYAVFDFRELLDQFLELGTEYHLWYLYTLAGIYLAVPFLKVLVDNCSIKRLSLLMVIMLLCTTIRPFINTITPLYFHLFDTLFSGYMGCFFMGYVFGKCRCDKKNIIWYILFGIACLALSIYFNDKNSSTAGINLIFNYGYSFVHYGLAVSIFTVSRFIFENRSFLRPVVTFISKYSFGIYLVHVMVIDLIHKYIMIDASPLICSAYIFSVCLVVSLILSFVLNKIKFVRMIVS